MKRSLSKKEIVYLIIGAIAFASLIYALIDSILDEILLAKNYRYTISEEISYAVGAKTDAENKYTFIVNEE